MRWTDGRSDDDPETSARTTKPRYGRGTLHMDVSKLMMTLLSKHLAHRYIQKPLHTQYATNGQDKAEDDPNGRLAISRTETRNGQLYQRPQPMSRWRVGAPGIRTSDAGATVRRRTMDNARRAFGVWRLADGEWCMAHGGSCCRKGGSGGGWRLADHDGDGEWWVAERWLAERRRWFRQLTQVGAAVRWTRRWPSEIVGGWRKADCRI